MNYLDSNFISALHFSISRQTEMAEKYVRKSGLPFVVSELAEIECRRAFINTTGRGDSEQWRRFQVLLESGKWNRMPVTWQTIAERAEGLMNRFAATIPAGTLDTLHVAHALHLGCTHFLSFDTRSQARVLASKCRLKVYPELSAEEKRR